MGAHCRSKMASGDQRACSVFTPPQNSDKHLCSCSVGHFVQMVQTC